MPILTVSPDAHTETDTVDGSGLVSAATTNWATLRGIAVSNHQDDSAGVGSVGFNIDQAVVATGGGASGWKRIQRSIFLFDIDLPENAEVESVSLKLYVVSKAIGLGDMDVVVVQHDGPASNTDLANTDFDIANFDFTTALSDLKAVSELVESAYNTFNLNASGLALVVDGAITKLAVVLESDRTNTSPPANTDNAHTGFIPQYAEGANPPILEISYFLDEVQVSDERAGRIVGGIDADIERLSGVYGGDGRYVEHFSDTDKKDAVNTTGNWPGDGTARMSGG